MRSRAPGVVLAMAGVLPWAFGCDSGSTGPPLSELSTQGTFTLTVQTAGAPLDVDSTGYRVVIDTLVDLAIGTDTTLDVTVRGGVRPVLLDSIQENCTVMGSNPDTVEVSIFEANAPVTFDVTCAFLGGSVRVVTATTGPDPDPDGYVVDLDGADSTAIALDAEVTWPTVRAGTHTVTLSGLDGPCVTADNPRAVVVAFGQEAEVRFEVTCAPPSAP